MSDRIYQKNHCGPMRLTDEDIMEAMKHIRGHTDITPEAFHEIYQLAYAQVMHRVVATQAQEIMTAKVRCLPPDMPAQEAAEILAKSGISGAPVVDTDGIILGVISEKDFLRLMGVPQATSFMRIIAHCLNFTGCLVAKLHHLNVAELMSAPPITGRPETPLSEISLIFREQQINRLPICNAQGRPVGIVSRTDLVNALCAMRMDE